MTTYSTLPLPELLDAFASPEPLPGGGSAAALTASLGASLLLMVASMAKTRRGSAEDAAELAAVAEQLRPIRRELTRLIDEDSRAYQEVIAAYRAPKNTDAERAARGDAIQRAVRHATEVPLETMRLCERALRVSGPIVALGNPNAVTDAVVGTRLLRAAVDSAGLNVDANVSGVGDAEYVRRATEERRALAVSAQQLSPRQ